MLYTKKGTIDRIENSHAIIHLEDGQKLLWEHEFLPSPLKEGSNIILEIKDSGAAQKDNQELAKNILHEIFNTVPQKP